jgi:[ribosomal protein S5]-alanine N-acetyltransferase
MNIDTARLTLGPVAAEDHAELYALFTQPGVRRFVFDNQVLAPDAITDIVGRSIELFRTRHFGLWLARLKAAPAATTPPVGFGAFWYFRDPPELELLYGVADAEVGRGYGREIARAVVDYGLTRLAMAKVRASTDSSHLASRRLLEAIGFTFERQAVVGGLDTAFYVSRTAY